MLQHWLSGCTTWQEITCNFSLGNRCTIAKTTHKDNIYFPSCFGDWALMKVRVPFTYIYFFSFTRHWTWPMGVTWPVDFNWKLRYVWTVLFHCIVLSNKREKYDNHSWQQTNVNKTFAKQKWSRTRIMTYMRRTIQWKRLQVAIVLQKLYL